VWNNEETIAPTAERSLSIGDQRSYWAGKLNSERLTHYNLADANYTIQKKNIRPQRTNTTCYTKLQRCELAPGNFIASKQLFHCHLYSVSSILSSAFPCSVISCPAFSCRVILMVRHFPFLVFSAPLIMPVPATVILPIQSQAVSHSVTLV